MLAACAMDPGEEPPSMFWGLDPVFSAFARLYVQDILQMKESRQVPGIYFYNCHPIFKVDVLGTVVYKKEREDFFCFGVDDGTGVINCLCWKNEQWQEQETTEESKANTFSGAHGGFNPVSEIKKLKQTLNKNCCLEIGELLRVRGTVKTSRQQREIMASTYYKVSDPVMAVQIAWMMEAPKLYRQCYDKPFQCKPNSTGASASSCLSRATHIIKKFLKDEAVTRFRPYDIQDLLLTLVPSPTQKTAADQGTLAGPSSSKQLRQLLQEVLQILQDEGTVFRKVKTQEEVYHVTEQDKELLIKTKEIVKEDSKREKYAVKGCHILHILSGVRQRYSPNVSKAALELVLKSLECKSEIISSSDCHYTVL